ncbi:hypothetical protein SAMD00019534_091800 [Acytostelium subglobosum LB1]|uniref:hypothetical protein n=1 Tax=Acytostelium subglobosum LB1 TaxID=1410327 RepID=UPI000644C94A|nr:hypothetical protein SAMD00019534_091800 [Acytostelium subglobosum LB1]GAM26005.1 hypothetical protein SAMD00019534_091800 [Acytostelium subglobosum LB1]|eukprot:XP_012751048.1 hypothetical protein SAMD00019534_091800 [Acytostelium subglobosum LB1]
MLADGWSNCLDSACNRWFRSNLDMSGHMQLDHGVETAVVSSHLQLEHGVETAAVTALLVDQPQLLVTGGDVVPPLPRVNLNNFSCQHEFCDSSYMVYSQLRNHCKEEHACTWTYAACPNHHVFPRIGFKADPKDTESIRMMLANGLIKCPHASCTSFFPTHGAKQSHLTQAMHQCAEPWRCRACQQLEGSVEEDIKHRIRCMHSSCAKVYSNTYNAYAHCASVHRCACTYATCPNLRHYQKKKFSVLPDDTKSITMMLANGLIKCTHTDCHIYFIRAKSQMNHVRKITHQCIDPSHCRACQKRRSSLGSIDSHDHGVLALEEHEHSSNRLKKRNKVTSSNVDVHVDVDDVDQHDPAGNVHLLYLVNLRAKRTIQQVAWRSVAKTKGDNGEGENVEIEDKVTELGALATIFNIKCPHISCESSGTLDEMLVHLGEDHKCPTLSLLPCDGCKLDQEGSNWLLI